MNELFYRSIMVCRYRLRGRIWNRRLFFTAEVFLIYLYLNEEGLLDFAKQCQVRLTPFVFPFLSSDWICQMLLSGYFLWLVSDLCCDREADDFVRVRAGERAWRLGNCQAIIFGAAVYTLVLIIVSALLLFPYMEFTAEWGKGWNTLARTNASVQFHIQMQIQPMVIRLYQPVEAVFLSGMLQFLCLRWLSLLMYLLNDWTKRPLGIYVVIGVVFWDVLLSNTMQERFYIYSPISLEQLGNYTPATSQYEFSLGWAVLFYLVGIAIFSAGILYRCERRDKKCLTLLK